MVRTLCIFALFLLSAFSCSKEEPIPTLQEHPVPVTRVDAPATAQAGATVPVDVYFTVNNGCGQFGSFAVNAAGKEQEIQVMAVYKGETCTDDLPTRKVTYTFRPTDSGTYTLRFKSTPSEGYITRTIEVGNPR
ncbi:hypothetical protein [Pontibacter roseus]|uniref:hypothetical protein n=1 Tax=Pontibacter roseus TaxID=336989 RepID=UPI0003741612|nr:hypothetical protein [Pontibacter roseus]